MNLDDGFIDVIEIASLDTQVVEIIISAPVIIDRTCGDMDSRCTECSITVQCIS
jgi:hypothetical protein